MRTPIVISLFVVVLLISALTAAQPPASVRVVDDSAVLFAEAVITSERLDTVTAGTVLDVVGQSGDWFHVVVTTDSGAVDGWIHTSSAEPVSTEPVRTEPANTGPLRFPNRNSQPPPVPTPTETAAPTPPARSSPAVPTGAGATFAEDDDVTLKIPIALLEVEGRRIWNGTPIYAAEIRPGQGDVVVNGASDWRLSHFPSMLDLRVEKIDRRGDRTEVELRNDLANVKLRFSREFRDPQVAFRQVMAKGSPTEAEASAYRDEAYARIAGVLFRGPLQDVLPEAQQRLLLFAHMTASGTGISHERFRDEDYLAIDLGTDDNVYNTLQLNQSQRVARIMNDRLLNVLKAFADPVREVDAIHGVKLDLRIPHRSFLDEDVPPDVDEMRVYAASDDIRAFADFEITNQEFIDRCFVIINENRVQVLLADG